MKEIDCEMLSCSTATVTVKINPKDDPDKRGRTELKLCNFCADTWYPKGKNGIRIKAEISP